ncbi:ATP-binding cassette domain-containing protein [bacterium]|nr:ATP-binding cassette domain-containing protein [bacterium]
MGTVQFLKFQSFQHHYMQGTPFESLGLEIPAMELELRGIYGIFGSTGSGKSTFCKLVAGLLDGGDKVVEAPWPTKQIPFHVGYVFQQPEHQVFEETVRAELCFALRNFKVDEGEWEIRCRESLDLVGLPETLLQRDPLQLSGGEKRRVAIASILAYRPKLLILDEPLAGVDGPGKRRIIDTILAVERSGATIFWVSHDLNDLLRHAKRSLYFKEGRLESLGNTFEVIKNCGLEKSILIQFMEQLCEVKNWENPVPDPGNLKRIQETFINARENL